VTGFVQFIRERQYLHNLAPATLDFCPMPNSALGPGISMPVPHLSRSGGTRPHPSKLRFY
jgi:hypothetical protein